MPKPMQHKLFYRLGICIYPLRWYIIGIWAVLVLACAFLLPNIDPPFKTTGFAVEHSQSERAMQEMDKMLRYDSENKFIIMYNSKHLLATNALYRDKIKKSLSGLVNFPIKHDIYYPDSNKNQISKDKHTAYVVVVFKTLKPLSDELVKEFKSSIKTPSRMTLTMGGESIFVEAVNKQTQTDLYRADFIAAPVALITLIVVFRSLIAAVLPLLLGGSCALLILTGLYFIGHVFTLSIFTLNIALLLGLCLSLDYALFIVSRFRDELMKGLGPQEAVACTQATAGKAIFFSGLAVFASLSGLILFPINILFSVAVGGLVAVFFAVLGAVILLPALLSVLNTNINRLPVCFLRKDKGSSTNIWHKIAEKVVKRPLIFFFPILIVLLMLGYPFLSAQFGVSDDRIFPMHSEHRLFFDTYTKHFNDLELSPINAIIKTEDKSILSRQNLSKLYRLTHQLKRNPLIDEVDSIVTTDPPLTRSQYYALYHAPRHRMSSGVKSLLQATTRDNATVITIISKYPINSPQMKTLVQELRDTKLKSGMRMEITGTPVNNEDVVASIAKVLPYAMLWIMSFTYLILLLLLRSVLLPIKAITMNLLSLCACYGALVLVFQDGYLHQFLNFDPQGMLDISILVIIFCALFGFSMDYEVFLLTRIKEFHDITHDTNKSIIFGIEKSGRIITSAALIVIFTCGSFLVADVLMVKAFGLGIAVAIFVDAFLIRTILVPSTMALMKSWNWYLPQWLERILPK